MKPNENQPVAHPLEAITRWENGHHLFFALIQALIVIHRRFEEAAKENDWHAASDALTDASEVWWACAAAFHFTGDFTVTAFDDIVRRSMEPPFEVDGFSGLHSADHTFLLQTLKRVKPLLNELPDNLKRRHRVYLWALDAMYESHAWVCHFHVGDKASLKMDTAENDAPAHEAIRKLKARTQKLAGNFANLQPESRKENSHETQSRPTDFSATADVHTRTRARDESEQPRI